MYTWIIGIVFIIYFIRLVFKRNKSIEPPGPKGLPIIGIAHKVDPTGLHKSVTKWSEEYGDVMKINVFGDEFVVLNNFENIYDALVLRSEEFAGRPSWYRFKVLTGNCNSVISSNFSPKWLAMKKLLMQKLKMYGPNLLKLEDLSLNCIKLMIDELSTIAESSEAVNLKPILHQCITNIMTSLICGRMLDKDSIHNILMYEECSQRALAHSTSGMLLDKFPCLRYFPLNRLHAELVSSFHFMKTTLEIEIQKNKNEYIDGEVNCVMDALINHQYRNNEHKNENQLTEDDLYILNSDMIGAGTITTTLTLMALFACLVNKPEVQQRMAEEIGEVLGNREPRLKDRESLPFIEAAILEILRYHSMLPFNLFHMTTTDTTMGGYSISKGTKLFFNFWKVNHDPEFWDMPWEFNPERFLDQNGKLVPIDHPRRKRLITFSAGRRICPGETLARSRMFLLVTSLLQHFEFLPESENNRPSHDPRTYTCGIEIYPMPYKVKLSKH